MENTFDNKIAILAELWDSHRTEPLYKDFVEWYDFTLPLAWALKHGFASPAEPSLLFFDRAYANLLEMYGVEDNLYSDYSDLTGSAEQ